MIACFPFAAQSLSPLPLMSGSQDVPGRGLTISLNDSEAGPSSVPLDSPPQYMPDSPPEYSVLPSSAGEFQLGKNSLFCVSISLFIDIVIVSSIFPFPKAYLKLALGTMLP